MGRTRKARRRRKIAYKERKANKRARVWLKAWANDYAKRLSLDYWRGSAIYSDDWLGKIGDTIGFSDTGVSLEIDTPGSMIRRPEYKHRVVMQEPPVSDSLEMIRRIMEQHEPIVLHNIQPRTGWHEVSKKINSPHNLNLHDHINDFARELENRPEISIESITKDRLRCLGYTFSSEEKFYNFCRDRLTAFTGPYGDTSIMLDQHTRVLGFQRKTDVRFKYENCKTSIEYNIITETR